MDEELNIKLMLGVVEVEGIRFSHYALKHSLPNPPTNALFSFKREGSQLIVSRYDNAEAAAKFFDEIKANP